MLNATLLSPLKPSGTYAEKTHCFTQFWPLLLCSVSSLLKALVHLQALTSEILKHFTIQTTTIHSDFTAVQYTRWCQYQSLQYTVHVVVQKPKPLATVHHEDSECFTKYTQCVNIFTVHSHTRCAGMGWAALVTQFISMEAFTHWVTSAANFIPSHPSTVCECTIKVRYDLH